MPRSQALPLTARSLALACATAWTTGCITSGVHVGSPAQAARIAPHAVFVNNSGRGARWRCNDPACPQKYDQQLHLIADSIRQSGKKRILIRIHGGLNPLSPSLDVTDELLGRMMADSSASGAFYPIFINWDSGLRSSYLEHLFLVTQGKRYDHGLRGASRVAVSPVYLVADVGRAATRIPFTLGQQAQNWIRGFQHMSFTPDTTVDDGIQRSLGGWKRPFWQRAGHMAQSLVLVPLKMGEVIVVDAFGTPAWDNMHRRTNTMFRDPAEFEHTTKRKLEECAQQKVVQRCETETYSQPTGAVAVLLDTLRNLVRGDTSFRFTLIGHSMGAIVADEIVRTSPDLAFDDIVFMAGASSVREFEVGVLPYLESHHQTQFYNLSLHPKAELQERTFLGFGPNGSLLEWIDAYLAQPGTDLDWTMGKYDTMRESEHIFRPGVRTQIHIKAFGYGDGLGCGKSQEPYHHGGFNAPSVPFWRQQFWSPGLHVCGESETSLAGTPR